jgi:VWFA-related protein
MSSDLTRWFFCAAVIGATAVATARQPTFRSGVDLVTVDAAVLDGEGRPVPGLRAEDFRIEVDGRPRRIVSAQFIDLTESIALPQPSAAHFSSNAGAGDGRIVVIAVDETHIRRLEGRRALDAASRFIDVLPALDRVGVISLTTESAFTLTRDRRALRQRITGMLGRGDLSGGQFNLGISEALEIADGGRARLADAVLRECGRSLTEYVSTARAADDPSSARDSCPEQLEQQSRGLAQQAHAQARTSLAALEALIARLKDLPGPKTIVLLSEGMIVDPRRIDLSRLAAGAQAARVTIYSLLLDIPLFDATQERVSPSADRDRQVREDGVDRVTGAARGAVFRQVGSDAAPLARIARELSGHYLLAFEASDGDRDARAHRIRVTMAGGRQLVRARTHFSVSAAPPPARGAQLSALLRAMSPATELPLRVATYTYAEPARRALRVVISAEAGNGTDGVGAWLGFVLVDAAGVIAATATVESRSGQYAFSSVVPEGRYTLRAAAIDAMGLQGSVERVFVAKLAGTAELRCGDLMLAPVPATRSAPLSPIVDRATGDALVAYLEFQATDATRSGPVRVIIARGPSEPPLLNAIAEVSIRTDGWATARATIPIAELPPGSYLARAHIDVAGAPASGISRPFTIAAR